jgi:polar amino acid transport system substrate-binding protein
MRTIGLAVAALAAITFAAAGPAQADKLDDVVKSGKLRCGVISGAKPFGFQDERTRELVGYDIDFCKAVAARMGVTAQPVQVSVEGRIPELRQGSIDILSAALGYSPARAEQIDFSDTYFVGRQIVMFNEGAGFNDLASLAQKKVSTAKGSSTEQYLRQVIPTAVIMSYQDIPSAFLALVQKKVDAIALTDVAALQLKEMSPNPLSIVPEPLVKFEPWGLGIAKGETRLTTKINEALKAMEDDGEAKRIFQKWFGDSTERIFKVAPITHYLK